MSQWLRVFGRGEKPPEPGALLDELRRLAPAATAAVRADEQGWLAIGLNLPGAPSPLVVERFLASEKGIRGELNTWAAWLETCDYSDHHEALMERVIQTQQLFTIRRPLDHPNEAQLDNACELLCRWLAAQTDGVYQIDNQGFFTADGTLLVQEY